MEWSFARRYGSPLVCTPCRVQPAVSLQLIAVTACACIPQGTSMATPVTAASAALVRQYLQDGFYPTGTRTPANAYPTPSGALVKALLMAGAAPLQGHVMVRGANPAAHNQLPLFRCGPCLSQ